MKNVFILLNKKYLVVTLHRQSNVDHFSTFNMIIKKLNSLSKKILIIFPYHPRIKKNISNFKSKYNTAFGSFWLCFCMFQNSRLDALFPVFANNFVINE